MESRSAGADTADGIISTASALELLFDSILDEFADIDEFRRETCPVIFIVYAHDNPQKGEAKADVVRRIIGWLERSHCEVLSDKAPQGQFTRPRDTTTVRNILDSQFRLLPRSASGSELGDNASVDKVVVCGSEVLENYARDDFTAPFIDAVKEAYMRPGHPKHHIRRLVESKTQVEGFHHVLTELAFLELRRSGGKSDHGIIPLALCGELPSTYLPKFVENCDVVLKMEQSANLSDQHRLFFKLLAQIYTDSHVAIRQFKGCYDDTVKKLNEQGPVTTNEATRIIRSRLASASRALRDHIAAAIRVTGTARDDVENKRKARRLRLMGMLSPLPYRDRKDRNQVREEGTCVWATTHPRFEAWKSRPKVSLLWISADPGCGKSVLAKCLVDEVLPASATRTACYFFFKDDFDDQRSIENALRCILHQLFSHKSFLLSDTLLDKFDNDRQLLSSAHGLWDVLVQATSHSDAGQVVCILDALDECKKSGRKFLGEQLTSFYLKQESRAFLKFLITSHPYLDIERDFRRLEDQMPTIRLAGESDAEVRQIEKEIDIVIKKRVEDLKTIARLSDDECHVLLKGLTRVPNRTYLWVALTFDVVWAAIKTNRADLEAILRELPPRVDDAYERILSRNQGRANDCARAILKIIVAATRPLSLLEMSQALALEESPAPQDILQYQNEDEFRHNIRHLCGLFVTIFDSKIYLLHQTAREFLLRKPQSTSGSVLSQKPCRWRESLLLTECHRLLAQLCLDCLHFQTSSFDAFTNYAAVKWTWAFHLRAAGNTTPTQHMLLQARKLCDAQYLMGPYYGLGWSYLASWDHLYEFDWTKKSGSRAGRPTALIIASALGLEGVVRLLLNDKKAKILAVEERLKRSAFLWACAEGHTDVVQTLLDRMSWITSRRALRKEDANGKTPLLLAIEGSHQAMARLLLDRGAQAKVGDGQHATPLHLAAQRGFEDITQLLLDKGARVNAKDDGNYTALSEAIFNDHDAVARLLVNRGANVNPVCELGITPLFAAVKVGNEAVARLLLDRGAQANLANINGWTPLFEAASKGREEITRLLLDRGAHVDAADNSGCTPLFEAAVMGREEVTQLLLDRGAHVNAADISGRTPLYNAARRGNKEITRLLLDRGAHVNAADKNGCTPLHKAAYAGYEEVTQLLLDRGAQINATDKKLKTPLFQAVRSRADSFGGFIRSRAGSSGGLIATRLLLARGARVNARDAAGQTPLYLARTSKMARALVEAGAQTNIQDSFGQTPLHHVATTRADASLVKQLLKLGASPDIRNNVGETPLEFFEKLNREMKIRKKLDRALLIHTPERRIITKGLVVLRDWVEKGRHPTSAT